MMIKIDNAEESLNKLAKSHGNSGMVSVPKSWIGRKVNVILLKEDDDIKPVQEFMIEYDGFMQCIKVDWNTGEMLFLHPDSLDWVEHRDQLNRDWSYLNEDRDDLYEKFLDEIFDDGQLLDCIVFMDVNESIMTCNGHEVTRIV